MIRDNTKKETKVFNEDYGFGIFKGWFQDSVDIASVEWENGNRTVLHKRDLTEVEDENEVKSIKDVNKTISEDILNEMQRFGDTCTLGERHLGFIRLKDGRIAEMTIRINTDDAEWLEDEPNDA